VKLEEMIGKRIRTAREMREWTQQELGQRVEPYLGRAWTRQAVSTAEKGGRDFTAAELVTFASVFHADVATFFLPDAPTIELPGCTLTEAELFERAAGAHLVGSQRRAGARLAEVHELARRGLEIVTSALDSADTYVEWLREEPTATDEDAEQGPDQ
jgi:transcriptional regulator with XRE-family HTH domain